MGFWSPRIAGVSRSLLWKMSVDRSSFLIELVDLVRGGYGEGMKRKGIRNIQFRIIDILFLVLYINILNFKIKFNLISI